MQLIRTSIIVAIVFLVVLAPPLFAGAVQEPEAVVDEDARLAILNPDGLPIVSETIEVNVTYPRRDYQPEDFSDMWWTQEVLRRTNIRINFRTILLSAWEERKSLLFASGDYPEAFLAGITRADENTFGPQGVFQSLTDLIDRYAPKTQELLEEFPQVRNTFTHPDGSIYVLPAFRGVERDLIPRMYLNEAWLENLNLPIPTTLGEFVDMLYLFKEADPNQTGEDDTIPVVSSEIETIIMASYGLVDTREDVVDGEYVFVPMTDEYREFLLLMNQLYSDRIIDREYYTQEVEARNAKYASGDVGIIAWAAPWQYIVDDAIWPRWVHVGPMTSHLNPDEAVWPMNPPYTRAWGTFALTDKARHPEAMVRLQDYFYTKPGTRMVRAGPEIGDLDPPYDDLGYRVVDMNGVEGAEIKFEGSSYFRWRALHTPLNVPYNSRDENEGVLVIGSEPRNQWITDQVMASGLLDVMRLGYPEVNYTDEELRDVTTLLVDIDSYVEQMEAEFITGRRSIEGEWDSFIATLERLGVDRMIEIQQRAYDRWAR